MVQKPNKRKRYEYEECAWSLYPVTRFHNMDRHEFYNHRDQLYRRYQNYIRVENRQFVNRTMQEAILIIGKTEYHMQISDCKVNIWTQRIEIKTKKIFPFIYIPRVMTLRRLSRHGITITTNHDEVHRNSLTKNLCTIFNKELYDALQKDQRESFLEFTKRDRYMPIRVRSLVVSFI